MVQEIEVASEALKFSEREIGEIMALAGLVSLVVLYTISRFYRSSDTRPLLYMGVFLVPLGALLFGLSNGIFWCGLGFAALIAGRVSYVVHMRIARVDLIEPELFGIAVGFFLSFIFIPLPLSGVIVSHFHQSFKTESIIMAACVLFVLIFVLYAVFRHTWRVRSGSNGGRLLRPLGRYGETKPTKSAHGTTCRRTK